jgi:hypothetical protein
MSSNTSRAASPAARFTAPSVSRGSTPPPVPYAEVLTVQQFCAAYAISRAQFYALCARKCGPDTLLVGRRRLISVEAARAWVARMSATSSKS